MRLTEYYHVRDPMENLLISVTLRKISGCTKDVKCDVVPVGKTWKYCFLWQEKKLSLSERKREHERLQAQGTQLLNNGTQRDSKSSEVDSMDILASYVDVDDFVPEEETPSTSKEAATHLIPPDFSRRPRDRRNKSSWTLNQQRAWLRANREDKFRAMHLVALIEGVERVLCSLRFYKESGLFCATPGFSAPIVDVESDPDLLTKGPKLTTYHISTQSGALYEYVLDNTYDLLPFEDEKLSRDIRLQEEKRDLVQVTRWQQLSKNHHLSEAQVAGGNTTKRRKLMLSLEIMAVNNLQTADPVCVEYELEFPLVAGSLQWRLQAEDCNQGRGKTLLSLPQRSAFPDYCSCATFGCCQQFTLTLVKAESSPASKDSSQTSTEDDSDRLAAAPILHLRVFSQDDWQRKRAEGHGEIKLHALSGSYEFDVPLRRSITSIRSKMEELFLGIHESTNEKEQRSVNLDASPISSVITSRLGHKSESTGSFVRIRCNVVDLQPFKPPGKGRPIAAAAPPNARIVKRSVQEILRSVKLGKRLASGRDPRFEAALRMVPSSKATESVIANSKSV